MILGPAQILVFLSRLSCLGCHRRGAHANISTEPSRGRNTHHHQWLSPPNLLEPICCHTTVASIEVKSSVAWSPINTTTGRNVLNIVVTLLISDDCWKYSNDNHHEESFSPRLSTSDEPSLSAAIIRLVVLRTRAVNGTSRNITTSREGLYLPV